jgi:hypothetical protein
MNQSLASPLARICLGTLPPRSSNWARAALLGIALCFCLTGCTAIPDFLKSDRPRVASSSHPVTQILCLWQPGEGRDPDGLPCRGFAGQVIFLTNREPTPVVPDGDVRIYVFDDLRQADDPSKPLRQYDFTDDSWSIHRRDSTLGPTYHVFIPYTRKGLHEALCSLRVRLTPPRGQAVFSDMVSVTLKGRDRMPEGSVQSEYTIAPSATPNAEAEARRKTTTIALDQRPGELARTPHSADIPTAQHPLSDNQPAIPTRHPLAEQLVETQIPAIAQVGEQGIKPATPPTAAKLLTSDERIERVEQLLTKMLELQQITSQSKPAAPPRHPLADE